MPERHEHSTRRRVERALIATRRDVVYGLVIIWALLGIAVKQSGNQNIVTTTAIGAIIIVIALAASILVSKLRR